MATGLMRMVRKVRSIGPIRSVEARVRQSLRDEQVYRSLLQLEGSVDRLNSAHRWLGAVEPSLASRGDSLDSTVQQVHDLEARLADLSIHVAQLTAVLRREGNFPMPPPKHLQVRVVGGYVPGFVQSGNSICEDFEGILQTAGKSLRDFPRILDWGCGCGRVSASLRKRLPSCELHGADIDPEAIAWLQQNYGQFGEFRVFPHRPPTSFADGSIDLVLGLSVFTHLPEDMQFEWLQELTRITAPGGYLILTTSGEANYRNADPMIRDVMRTKGFHYSDPNVFNYGRSISLPDFYQNAFHSVDYIRREWSKYFEILEILPTRVQNHQDAVLVRNRPRK